VIYVYLPDYIGNSREKYLSFFSLTDINIIAACGKN
jgi:hypothetical protein